MTQHQRALAVGRPDRALAVVVLDVRAAEAARGDLDEHLVLGDRRLGDVLDTDVVGLVEELLSLARSSSAVTDVLVEQGVERHRSVQVSAQVSAVIGIASTDHHLLDPESTTAGMSASKSTMPLPIPRCVPKALCRRVRVRVADVHVADLPGHHLDELGRLEPLLRLHAVVRDDAARLDVTHVEHQLQVVVADVLEQLHGLGRLDEELPDSSSQSIVTPSGAALRVLAEGVTTRSHVLS